MLKENLISPQQSKPLYRQVRSLKNQLKVEHRVINSPFDCEDCTEDLLLQSHFLHSRKQEIRANEVVHNSEKQEQLITFSFLVEATK